MKSARLIMSVLLISLFGSLIGSLLVSGLRVKEQTAVTQGERPTTERIPSNVNGLNSSLPFVSSSDTFQTRDEAVALFMSLDLNQDGVLSEAELAQGLADFGITDEQIADVFLLLDTDGDSRVSLLTYSFCCLTQMASLSLSLSLMDGMVSNGAAGEQGGVCDWL